MEKKQSSIEKITERDFGTIAVISESITTWLSGKYGAVFFMRKQPRYIIFFKGEQRKILRISGEEISHEELVQECNDAGDLMNSML